MADATDATLSGLSVSGTTLSPTFHAATTSYQAPVANAVSQGTITAMTSESTATVEYLDGSDNTLTDADAMTAGLQHSLSVGTNIVKVEVTAPDLMTKETYTIKLLRIAATATCSAASMLNQIWTGQLTVGLAAANGFIEGDGGYLDDKTITYSGTSHTVANVSVLDLFSFHSLYFGLASSNFGAGAADLVLHVDNNQYRLGDATLTDNTYEWTSNLPTFNNGDGVCLALTVDGPDVTSVALTSTPGSDNTYAIGDAVEATVTFDAAVDISGSPQLELDFDGTAKAAGCATGTNTTTMACSYTVAVGDVAAGGVAIAANKLTGGTIYATGSTTITADLTHTAVMIDAGHKVDGIRPTLVTTGTDAPTTSTDGETVLLVFSEDIGAVSHSDITIQANSVNLSTTMASVAGTKVEIALTTALTATATNLTVALAADAVEDTATNGILALAATAVTNVVVAGDALDKAALVALYDATDGSNWTTSTNWKTTAPLSEWYGVTTDVDGRVTDLYLTQNGLSGEIPAELGDLSSLQNLYLWQNNLSGAIPAELGDLANLQILFLEDNNLSGAIPAELGDLTSLLTLDLQNNNLSGEIPAELGDLTNLQNLYLRNNNLSGEIPAELGDLANLLVLDLQNNKLSGEIPAELGDLSSLQNLYLAQNGLSGEIPAELGDLTSLLTLDLQNNNLSGEIPEELGDLSSLQYLYLWGNELSGEIPEELGDLANLEILYLNQNELSGPIPAELGDLSNLQRLYLQRNQLTGTIPEELGDLTNLQRLYLYDNQLTGEIPAELGNLTNLLYLSLWSNQLTGAIPAAAGVAADRGALEGFYNATDGPNWTVGTNWLTTEEPLSAWHGVTTDSNGRVTRVVLSNNELTGTISVAVEQLENLEQLILSVNDELTGQLPEELRHLSNLEILNVSGTNVCAPTDAAFQAWLATITFQGGVCEPPGGGGGGGGGGGTPRTSVPSAVRNLMVAGGNGEVVLTWEAPEDDGGAEITDYEYRINGSGPWISTGSTETTHTVTGLDNGTPYVFEVRAVNRRGRGRVSNRNRAEATPDVFTLDFAHFANGEGLTSDLVFVNVGTHPIRPALAFYDQEGQPMAPESVVEITGDLEVTEDGALSIQTAIEPLGELTISTHGQGELVSGSARVTSGGPIGGGLRFDLPEIGVAGVGVSPPVRDAVFPVRRQEGGINTGVAIHNLESSPEIVRCELMREGVLRDAVSLPLAANGQSSWFIDAAFPAADTTDFAGSVRCDAEGPGQFTAVALELDAASRIFTTLPVLPVRRAGGRAAELTFAHFANGAGIISDLVFVNLSTEGSRPAPTPYHQDILPLRPTIYFYDTEGALVSAESVVDRLSNYFSVI